MKTRTLGKSGLVVSVVGLGGIPLQRVEMNDAKKIVETALNSGINFIDTARGYTDSEAKIGEALKNRRSEVVLATKSMARTESEMAVEIRASLEALQTDTIDLYQLHGVHSKADLDAVLAKNGAVKTLLRARDRGEILHIGITGHTRTVLVEALSTGLFETVQLPFNPLETEGLDDVIPEARRQGVGTIGMKPVAGGAFRNVQSALRFSLNRGVDVVIPGMDEISQVAMNAEVGLDFRDLLPEEIEEIEQEKEMWSGVFCRRCNYCAPCPNGLNISFLLLLEAYHERYGLKEWALDRLAGLEKKYDDCAGCEECMSRCPYNLPIPELLKKAGTKLSD